MALCPIQTGANSNPLACVCVCVCRSTLKRTALCLAKNELFAGKKVNVGGETTNVLAYDNVRQVRAGFYPESHQSQWLQKQGHHTQPC
jgi:hypothetical protein